MKDIQHYKDEVAKEHGYEDFDDMLCKTSLGKANDIIDHIMKRYAEDMCSKQKQIDINSLTWCKPDNEQQILNAPLATDN